VKQGAQLLAHMDTLERASRYLAKMPKAIEGQGGRRATFKAVVILTKKFGLSDEEAWPILAAWNQSHCEPDWTELDLHRMLSDALKRDDLPKEGRASSFDPELLERVAAESPDVDEAFIKSRSPLTVTGPDAFLRKLYKPGEHVLCFGGKKETQGTRWTHKEEKARTTLDRWKHEDWQNGAWFLIYPVTGEYILKEDGGRTRRSTENVTEHRYLLIESDHSDVALWLRAIAALPLKIVSLVKSGGKSIHALVNLDTHTLAEWRGESEKMKPFLTALGADPQAFGSAQLSRLPFITRAGVQQELIYLNPAADGTPIKSLPVSRQEPQNQ
jgi:hypothetical protein